MNKFLQGIVIKKKMNKTVIILVTKIIKHIIYGKFIKKKYKINVHDYKNICNLNDIIEVKKCKPISKNKFWIFSKFIKN